MRLLLDTHVLIWLLSGSEKIAAMQAIIAASPEVMFSAASIWEIAIKQRLGRADFTVDPAAIVTVAGRSGLVERAITAEIAAKVAALPMYHRDPFDRLLIAQAIHERAGFLTADAALVPYSGLVRLAT